MDHDTPESEIDESTRTSSRRSARNARVEVITRGARRRWSVELKREIVAESLGPDLTPSEVMRKYGIGSGQLYTWRRELLSLQTMTVPAAPRFTEVEVPVLPGHLAEVAVSPVETRPSPPTRARTEGLVEIVMPNGVVLRADAQIDGRALRRILAALSER